MITGATPQVSMGRRAPIVTPHPQRQDWFAVPASWVACAADSPRVQRDRQLGPIVHRSHLPIIAQHVAEAGALLAALNNRSEEDRIRDRAAFDLTTAANGWQLRSYQHVGREFIQARRGTLLGDSMRVGKTATVTASHDPASGPLLVVAPLATREVWLAWFKRRWPDVRPTVLAGRTLTPNNSKKPVKRRKDPGYDVLTGDAASPEAFERIQLAFCHYDILGAWKDFGHRRVGTLVLDEAHLVSQRASRRAKACTYAAVSAHRVVAVTGTPVWNRPAGLFTMLSCIAPGAFGSFFDFAMRYCDGRPGTHGYLYDGSSNEDEFRLRLSEIMIRRTWQEVSTELPAIERAVEVVEITAQQQMQVEKEAERVRNQMGATTAVGALAKFRRLLANLKIEASADAARRVLENREKVVVWTWHHDVAVELERALAKTGFPGYVVSGRTGQEIREEILHRWRTSTDPTPLVITLAVGQVGIDLSAARHEVFAELDFTPSIVAQAEMRVFSPLRPMAATYVIIDHDIDRKILAALQDKCDVALRMGVPAAESTIGVLATAFAQAADGPDDFGALAAAALADHPALDDLDDSGNFYGSLWTHDWEG